MFQNMVNVPSEFEKKLADAAALDSLPQEMIQYGVKFAANDGSQTVDSMRWRDWRDAAEFGESQVQAGHAKGFWVIKEASV